MSHLKIQKIINKNIKMNKKFIYKTTNINNIKKTNHYINLPSHLYKKIDYDDLVSILDTGKTHMKTLTNPHHGSLLGTVFKAATSLATGNPLLGFSAAHDILKSHDVNNIKDSKIFV